MSQYHRPSFLDLLETAEDLARENSHAELSTGHLLLAIATVIPNAGADALRRAGVTANKIRERLVGRKPPVAERPASVPYSAEATAARLAAGGEARRSGATETGPEHLLVALVSQPNTAVRILTDLGVPVSQIREQVQKQIDSAPEQNVFVIHGRDDEARRAMFGFLRDLGLTPLEWEPLVHLTGGVAPHIAEAVARGFDHGRAVIALFTPDDCGYAQADFREPHDIRAETHLTGQARQNVLYESGMAMMRMPDRTIFVEIGELRPFTDIAGRSVVRMYPDAADTATKLHKIVERLRAAQCNVDTTGTDWLRTDRFTSLAAHHRRGESA